MVARCCRSCGLKTPHTTPTPRPLKPKPETGAAAAVGGGVRGVSGSHHLGPVQGLHQCSSNRGFLLLWENLDFCMRRPFVDFCMRRPNQDFSKRQRQRMRRPYLDFCTRRPNQGFSKRQRQRSRSVRSLRQSSPGASPRSPHTTQFQPRCTRTHTQNFSRSFGGFVEEFFWLKVEELCRAFVEG